MTAAGSRSLVLVLLAAVCLILSSCGALDFFKSRAPADPDAPSQAAVPGPDMAETEPQDPLLATETAKKEADPMDRMQLKIDALEEKVSSLATQLAEQQKLIQTLDPSDPARLYQRARTLLLENKMAAAADLFATFVKAHPDHSLADNALYWLGECHYTRAHYTQAIEVFKDLVRQYPKAEKVPDALLKTGYAYLSLDDINRASHFLKLVIFKHPFSPAAEKAQAKLATLK